MLFDVAFDEANTVHSYTMENIPDVLKGIVERKRREIADWKKELTLQEDQPVSKLLTEAGKPGTPGTPGVQRSRRFYNAINKHHSDS